MRDRWDYRTVEGLLYRLGQPADARPSRALPTQAKPPSDARSREPSAPHLAERIDLGMAVKHSLDQTEFTEVQEHYVLGIKRHGYGRRSRIIKKLVVVLNGDSDSQS